MVLLVTGTTTPPSPYSLAVDTNLRIVSLAIAVYECVQLPASSRYFSLLLVLQGISSPSRRNIGCTCPLIQEGKSVDANLVR